MVDQLKVAAMKINKKNSVKGCVLLLVVCFNSVKGFFNSSEPFFYFLRSLISDNFFLVHFFLLQILYADSLDVQNLQIPLVDQGSLHGPGISWTRSLSWTQIGIEVLAD